MSKEEIGTLIVVVLKARNLIDKHTFRKQDVLAKVALNGTEKKTKVDIKGGQHPVWDDELRFPVMKVPGGKHRKLEVSCWSKEPRDDDLLGKGTLDISDIIKTGEFDEWVPLAIEDSIRGDLYLEITYYAHGPPPPSAVVNAAPSAGLVIPQPANNLTRRPSKMVASERLSRPTVNTSQQHPGPHHSNSYGATTPLTPQVQGSSSYFPHRNNQQLPPVQEAQAPQSPVGSQPLPSFLRPGSRPQPDPRLSVSSPSTQHNPYLSPISSSSQYDNRPTTAPPAEANPYLTSATPSQATPVSSVYNPPPSQGSYLYQHQSSPAPPTPAPGPVSNPYNPQPNQGPPIYQHQSSSQPIPGAYPPQQYTHAAPPPSTTPLPAAGSPPPIWGAGPTTQPPSHPFFFPVPSVLGTEPDPYQPPWASGPSPPPRATSPYDHRYHRQDSYPRDDPALLTRYQTPLPLPPGASNSSSPPPRKQASSTSPSRYKTPPKPAPSPPRPATTGPDPVRLMQLQRAEQEASRRREQEERDLELAMRLDRELNL